jgi:hypothetical protein
MGHKDLPLNSKKKTSINYYLTRILYSFQNLLPPSSVAAVRVDTVSAEKTYFFGVFKLLRSLVTHYSQNSTDNKIRNDPMHSYPV